MRSHAVFALLGASLTASTVIAQPVVMKLQVVSPAATADSVSEARDFSAAPKSLFERDPAEGDDGEEEDDEECEDDEDYDDEDDEDEDEDADTDVGAPDTSTPDVQHLADGDLEPEEGDAGNGGGGGGGGCETPGAWRCSGQMPQVCTAETGWKDTTACPGTCVDTAGHVVCDL